MTSIIFGNVHVWKLIHVCYFFTISLTLEEAVTAAEFKLELGSLLSRFCDSVRTKKSMNGVCETNIDCSFIREW